MWYSNATPNILYTADNQIMRHF